MNSTLPKIFEIIKNTVRLLINRDFTDNSVVVYDILDTIKSVNNFVGPFWEVMECFRKDKWIECFVGGRMRVRFG